MMERDEVGVAVICTVCGLRKKPIGRDAAVAAAGSLCDYDCPGYNLPPYPSDLWPGESRKDFGYPKEER